MALSVIGLAVSIACAWACVRRLRFAAEATTLDPRVLLAASRAEGGRLWPALRAEIASEPAAEWERDLMASLAAPGPSRIALVNEQLSELDYRAQMWARVPRVCASISTSSGFLLASLAMRAALASEVVDYNTAILSVVNVVAMSIAGAVFCIAAQARARTMVRERLAAVDQLVERVEALLPPGAEKVG